LTVVEKPAAPVNSAARPSSWKDPDIERREISALLVLRVNALILASGQQSGATKTF
jgi:hypothetical protein